MTASLWKSQLLTSVQGLGHPDELSTLKARLATQDGVNHALREKLFPPHTLLNSEYFSEIGLAQQITPSHPVFSCISSLIDAVGREVTKISEESSAKELWVGVLNVYNRFLSALSSSSSSSSSFKHSELFIGPALLRGFSVGALSVPQKLSRQIVSLDGYGDTMKVNAIGSSAVQKIDSVYYKRARIIPLNPGAEFLFASFVSLFSINSSAAAAPTMLLKLQNVWVKVASCDRNISHPLRPRILHLPLEYGSLSAGLRCHKDLKANYPFGYERRDYLVQASKSVDGENLHDLLIRRDQDPLLPHTVINATSFTLQVIFVLLFRLSDARADNYIVGADGDLTLIDADPLFEQPYHRSAEGHEITLRSALLLMPEMDLPLDPLAIDRFLSTTKHLDCFLSDWMMTIQRKNEEYLKQNADRYLSDTDFNELSLPITFSFADMCTLFKHLSMVRSLVLSLRSSPPNKNVNHWLLFSYLFPILSAAYHVLFNREGSPLLKLQELFSSSPPLVESLVPQSLRSSSSSSPNDNLLRREFVAVSEKLPIKDLLETWLHDLEHSVKDQMRLAELLLSLSSSRTLNLRATHFNDGDLRSLVNRFNIIKVTLDCAPNITLAGLLDLLSDFPSLCLVLGALPHLTTQDVVLILTFHQQNHRHCSFLLNDTELDTFSSWQGLCQNLLLSQEFVKFHAKIESGEQCTVEAVGDGLLHFLAARDASDAIRTLLQTGYPDNLLNSRCQSAVHIAAESGWIDNLPALLAREIRRVNDRDLDGKTPLHLAACKGHLDMIKQLLTLDADPLLFTKESESILHFAVDYNHQSVVEYILASPQLHTLIMIADSDGKYPLHRAVWRNPKPRIVELLLQAGTPADMLNKFGYTALHWAAKHAHLESARILLAYGADFTIRNSNQSSPLDLAIRYQSDQLVKLFINPDLLRTPPELSIPHGSSPKELASIYSRAFVLSIVEHQSSHQIFFLEKLADLALNNNEFERTAHLLNATLRIAQRSNLDPKYIDYLYLRLESIEGLFLEHILQKKTPVDHTKYLFRYRTELQALREGIAARQRQKESILVLQRDLSERTLCLLRDLVMETLRILDISESSICFLLLGPFATKECLPFSGLRFGMMAINEKECQYLQRLYRFLNLRIINMGETAFEFPVFPGMAAILPIALSAIGFKIKSVSASSELPLIGTPMDLAALHDSTCAGSSSSVDILLLNDLTQCQSLFPDNVLFNQYRQLLRNHLGSIKSKSFLRIIGGTQQQKLFAIQLLSWCVKREFPPLTEHCSRHYCDLDRDYHQPLTLIIRGLYLFSGKSPEIRTTSEELQTLEDKHVLGKNDALILHNTFLSLLQLCFSAHFFYQSRDDRLFLLPDQSTFEYQHLCFLDRENNLKIITIHLVLNSLRHSIAAFVRASGDIRILKNINLQSELKYSPQLKLPLSFLSAEELARLSGPSLRSNSFPGSPSSSNLLPSSSSERHPPSQDKSRGFEATPLADIQILRDQLILEPQPFASGSNAKVHRAAYFSNPVAVKKFFNVQDMEAFRREVVAWMHVRGHPNVLELFGVDVDVGAISSPLIVMELMDYSLCHLLYEERRSLRLEEKLLFARSIAAGLHYIHRKGLIHRDIKSLNVLVRGNAVKIADFGTLQSTRDPGWWRNLFGTHRYIAPEIYQLYEPTTASDVFALSMTLYEIFYSELPYLHLKSPSEIQQAVTEGVRPLLKPILGADLEQSAEICQLIESGWQREPPQRIPSGDMYQRLDTMISQWFLSSTATSPVAPHIINQEITELRLPPIADRLVIDMDRLRFGPGTEYPNPAASGQYGAVYRGLFKGLDVAVKVSHHWKGVGDQLDEFLLKEISNWAELHHPNVIALMGVSFEPQFILVMTWMPGSLKRALIEQDLGLIVRLRYAADIARGLRYMHSLQYLHRDLKADNILLSLPDSSGSQHALLADFGNCRRLGSSGFLETSTLVIGTPGYMAPEVWKGDHAGSIPIDIYALGVTFYEILLPDVSSSDLVTQPRPPEPSTIALAEHPVMTKFWQLIQECWRHQPAERPDAQYVSSSVASLHRNILDQSPTESR